MIELFPNPMPGLLLLLSFFLLRLRISLLLTRSVTPSHERTRVHTSFPLFRKRAVLNLNIIYDAETILRFGSSQSGQSSVDVVFFPL